MPINWVEASNKLRDAYNDTERGISRRRTEIDGGYTRLEPVKKQLGDIWKIVNHLHSAFKHLDDFFQENRFLQEVPADDHELGDNLAQKDLYDYCHAVCLARTFIGRDQDSQGANEAIRETLQLLREICTDMVRFMNSNIRGQNLLSETAETEISKLIDARQTLELLDEYGLALNIS